jgi:assimilatory nitrate reductase catalytic subunit
MAPFVWPANASQRGGRFFGAGKFHTPDRKARMLAVTAPAALDMEDFRLNTGRIRDQWHTMTRTAKSPRLSSHLAEPFLELHPTDAARLGLRTADLAEVTNWMGRAILRVLVTDRVAPGQPFAPIHWTSQTAPSGRIGVLVAANPDPVSGQPDSKGSRVAVARFAAGWHGFAVSTDDLRPDCAYWAKARVQAGWRAELAGDRAPADWVEHARRLFNLPDCEAVSVTDDARGLARVAFHREGRLVAALFAGRGPVALARDQVVARLGAGDPADALAGRARADAPDPGPTVCACLNVGLHRIRATIESGRALSVAALGEALGAGTSCGSCRPELAELVTRFRCREAAE